MHISLVICSKNGERRLPKCLGYVSEIVGIQDCEVILVDNGSTDRTHAIMTSFQANLPGTKVVQCERPGNSAGRNDAIEIASGSVLVFLDDDCYADSMLLKRWHEVFDRLDIGFGSGLILPFDDGQSSVGTRTDLEYCHYRPGRFIRRGWIQGSNMAFRRSALNSERFDETFGAGTEFAGEEWELVLRLLRAGWAGCYSPDPKVWHDHKRDESDAFSQLLFYDFGAGAIYVKSWRYSLNGYTKVLLSDIFDVGRSPDRIKSMFSGAYRYARLSGVA